VLKNGKGCIVIVNKWDLADVSKSKYTEDLRYVFRGMDFVPLVFTSSKTGENVKKTVELIDHVGAQMSATLPTGVLNRVIMRAFDQVKPPTVGGHRLNIFYATQTGTQPVRITLFVNDPNGMRPAYGAYIVKNLRDAFGLDGVPVLLQLRGRPRQAQGPHATGARKPASPRKGGASARPSSRPPKEAEGRTPRRPDTGRQRAGTRDRHTRARTR